MSEFITRIPYNAGGRYRGEGDTGGGVIPPADPTLLFSENFDHSGAGIDSVYWEASESGFNSTYYTPTTAQERFLDSPTIPDSSQGGYSANYYMQLGTNDEVPFRLFRYETYTEKHFRWEIFLKSPFNRPGGLKFLRLGNNSVPGPSLAFEYNNVDASNAYFPFYTYDGITEAEVNGSFNHTLTLDAWQVIDVYFKESTPNVADGRWACWINGVLKEDSGLVVTRSNSTSKNYYWLMGNNSWGGGTGQGGGVTVNQNQSLYVGSVRLYNTKPADLSF